MSQAHTEGTKTGRLRDRAQDTADAARDVAREKKRGAETAARQRAERFRTAAEEKASEFRSDAEATAETQKTQVAGRASNIASAMRTAASELHEQDEPLGVYAERASEHIDRLSRYLNEHSTADLVEDVELQARHNPWLFVGGAFAVGFAAGRFLKAGAGQRASTSTALQPADQSPPALREAIGEEPSHERPSHERPSHERPGTTEEDTHGHHS